jgi:hypothetical protein
VAKQLSRQPLGYPKKEASPMDFILKTEEFVNKWSEFIAPQRRPKTGFIPSAYESILRVAGIENINYATFQDDFDLDKNKLPLLPNKNNLSSVGIAITKKYPQIKLKRSIFPRGEGKQKLELIERIISKKRFVLITMNMWSTTGQDKCQPQLVVDMDENNLYFLSIVVGTKPMVYKVTYSSSVQKNKLIQIHDIYDGGHDVVYLYE